MLESKINEFYRRISKIQSKIGSRSKSRFGLKAGLKLAIVHQNVLLGPISDRYGTETKCKASFSTSNITDLSGGLMQELEIGDIDAHTVSRDWDLKDGLKQRIVHFIVDGI